MCYLSFPSTIAFSLTVLYPVETSFECQSFWMMYLLFFTGFLSYFMAIYQKLLSNFTVFNGRLNVIKLWIILIGSWYIILAQIFHVVSFLLSHSNGKIFKHVFSWFNICENIRTIFIISIKLPTCVVLKLQPFITAKASFQKGILRLHFRFSN